MKYAKYLAGMAFLAVLALSCSNYANLKDGLYAELDTGKGKILLALEYEKAPLTVANFVGLAEGTIKSNREGKKFYDGLTFHRVVKDFMIQGGDPEGTGSGGPGYKFADEFSPDLKHTGPGILSMANSGPNTNGSQFFITHKETPWLDGKHTIFGHVVEGQETVNAIAQGDIIKTVSIIRVGSKAQAYKATQQFFDDQMKAANDRMILETQQKKETEMKVIKDKWPDAIATSSGLLYKILKAGSGPNPSSTAEVTVHYTGTLFDGKEFDSSRTRNEPATFRIGQVIQGWNEALVTMKKGERRILIIPPNLGYGDRGAGGVIPPNAWLVFDVELLSFKN